MSLSNAMRAAASGMTAERFRMDVISVNIANSGTSGTRFKLPYQGRDVVLRPTDEGVAVTQLVQRTDPFPVRNVPGHPMADAQGNVVFSNVEPVNEMVNMLGASRAYEANVASFNAAKGMVKSAMEIGKV